VKKKPSEAKNKGEMLGVTAFLGKHYAVDTKKTATPSANRIKKVTVQNPTLRKKLISKQLKTFLKP
jgi:hypothetical protein